MFVSGFPYIFADKKYWYKNLKDMPWDLIRPFISEYNGKMKCLLRVLYLVLDESMRGFCPNTSAYGNLPNLTHKPHKPVSLGTMSAMELKAEQASLLIMMLCKISRANALKSISKTKILNHTCQKESQSSPTLLSVCNKLKVQVFRKEAGCVVMHGLVRSIVLLN